METHNAILHASYWWRLILAPKGHILSEGTVAVTLEADTQRDAICKAHEQNPGLEAVYCIRL